MGRGQTQSGSYFFRKVKTTQRLLRQMGCRAFGLPNSDSMNPEDYWYQKDQKIQKYYQEYFMQNIDYGVLNQNLKRDISQNVSGGEMSLKKIWRLRCLLW